MEVVGNGRLGRGLQRTAQMRELAGPVGEWRKRRMQRLLRHTDLMHHRAEFRRVEMTGDKAERLERLQQRR